MAKSATPQPEPAAPTPTVATAPTILGKLKDEILAGPGWFGFFILGLLVLLTLYETRQVASLVRQVEKAADLREWQDVVVYKILLRHGRDGATFQEISSEYLDEARKIESFNLPPSQLQDDVLTRILLQITNRYNIVYTPDGKYAVAQSATYVPFGTSCTSEKVKFELLSILSYDSGEYTIEQLGLKVSEKASISFSNSEFVILANELIVAKLISSDNENKVWLTALVPPRLKEEVEKKRLKLEKEELESMPAPPDFDPEC